MTGSDHNAGQQDAPSTYNLSRADPSFIGRWWWAIDRWTLLAILIVMAFGFYLVVAGSPIAAERLDLPMNYFNIRHAIFASLAVFVMIILSMCGVNTLRLGALVLGAGFLIATFATPYIGADIKGARRWISLGLGLSFQPAELLKPCLIVVVAWFFSWTDQPVTGRILAFAAFALSLSALILQPDIGMSVLVAGVFVAQLFVSGLSLIGLGLCLMMAVLGLLLAYLSFAHVRARIDQFLTAEVVPGSQADIAGRAFRESGWLGRGPAEGVVKRHLADPHTDFILVVGAEEFGLILTLALLSVFVLILVRLFARALRHNSAFMLLVISGLSVQIGLQGFINAASNLGLIPTKGMTFPMISFGGSSLIATALALGTALSLTRKRL